MKNGRNNKGQFAEGNTGRPKGAGNKLTSLQKIKIEKVLGLLEKTLEEDLAKLKANERVDLWASLQEFIRPKLQRTSIELDTPEDKVTKITFEVVKAGEASPSI
jgi:hypothetical protein